MNNKCMKIIVILIILLVVLYCIPLKCLSGKLSDEESSTPVITGILGNPDTWTKGSVLLTVHLKDDISGNVAAYRMDKKNDDEKWDDGDFVEVSDENAYEAAIFKVDTNGSYRFYAKNKSGVISDSFEVEVTKIDKELPEIDHVIQSTTNYTNQHVIYTIEASDEGSGIGGYGISDKAEASNDEVIWNEDENDNKLIVEDCNVHYLYVKDKTVPENISTGYKIQAVNFSKERPVIRSVDLKSDGKKFEWTNKKIIAALNIQNTKNGIKNDEGEDIEIPVDSFVMDPDTEQSYEEWEWQTGSTFEISAYKLHTFYIRDQAGNISEKYELRANYDDRLPELKTDGQAIVFSQTNNNFFSKIMNCITFGNFFNKKLKVEINAQDVGDENTVGSSGISSYFVYLYDSDGNVTLELENSVSNIFELNQSLLDNYKGTIKISIRDKAGNEYTVDKRIAVTSVNSNLEEVNDWTGIMIENDAPVIEMITPAEDTVHNKDFEIKFSISDITKKNYSGIAGVRVSVNDNIVLEELYSDYLKKTNNYSLNVDIARHTVNNVKVQNWNKGKLYISMEAYDNSGNIAKIKKLTYYTDQTSAIISGFDFETESNIDITKDENKYSPVNEALEYTDYGFYFRDNTNVTVYAEDIIGEYECKSSGVQSITVYLKEITDNPDVFNYYTVGQNGKGIQKISSINEAVTMNCSESISFMIPADFKGKIYAYATDSLGNNSLNSVNHVGTNIDKDGYVHSNGIVIESDKNHLGTSSIDIIAPKAVVMESFNAEHKVPLYNTDPAFFIKVSDKYSGIREVKWTIIQGGEKTEKNIFVENSGNINGDIDGWSTKKDLNTNLVTEVSNENLIVSENYNDIVLLVELKDRSGNVSYDYYTFGIDKTIPVTDIIYENNSANAYPDGNTYFKEKRVAVITVTERNFDERNVVIHVTKDENEFEVNSIWSDYDGSGNKDDSRHTTNIVYDLDGVYTFSIEVTDNAGNVVNKVNYADSISPEKFTIDMTHPFININYDNDDVLNGKYFKNNRTASITVIERNFDPERIRLSQTASLNSSPISVPSINWKDNGDTHIGTLVYNSDGDYTFGITMDDMAGNECSTADYTNSKAGEEFTIDTTIKKPFICGVENGKSYKDEVIPIISFEDINFDSDSIQLLRTKKDEIEVDVTEYLLKNISINEHGGSGTCDIFTKIHENDGIYKLAVKVNDKAGNEETESLEFSVNRFGSVYVFDNYLISLINSYINKVDKKLLITEYNPDRLIQNSVKVNITCDGSPVEDVLYTVSPVVNDTVTTGSSGWYEYEYAIDKDNFNRDGIYRISIVSEDNAGNKPETSNDDESELIFRVDKTRPEITYVSGMEEKIVNAKSHTIAYEIFDAIGLKSIDVYINYDLIDSIDTFENIVNYNGDILLGEGANQHLRFIIKDLAGNVTDTALDDYNPEFNDVITISTNALIRWYSNKVLFFGTLGSVTICSILIYVLIRVRYIKTNRSV